MNVLIIYGVLYALSVLFSATLNTINADEAKKIIMDYLKTEEKKLNIPIAQAVQGNFWTFLLPFPFNIISSFIFLFYTDKHRNDYLSAEVKKEHLCDLTKEDKKYYNETDDFNIDNLYKGMQAVNKKDMKEHRKTVQNSINSLSKIATIEIMDILGILIPFSWLGYKIQKKRLEKLKENLSCFSNQDKALKIITSLEQVLFNKESKKQEKLEQTVIYELPDDEEKCTWEDNNPNLEGKEEAPLASMPRKNLKVGIQKELVEKIAGKYYKKYFIKDEQGRFTDILTIFEEESEDLTQEGFLAKIREIDEEKLKELIRVLNKNNQPTEISLDKLLGIFTLSIEMLNEESILQQLALATSQETNAKLSLMMEV